MPAAYPPRPSGGATGGASSGSSSQASSAIAAALNNALASSKALEGMRAIPFCPDLPAADLEAMNSGALPSPNDCPLFNKENGQVEVLDAYTNQFRYRAWASLRPGDVCRLYGRETIPADMLLLRSSSVHQTAIDLAWYDGDPLPLLRQVATLPESCPIAKLGTGSDCIGIGGASSSSSAGAPVTASTATLTAILAAALAQQNSSPQPGSAAATGSPLPANSNLGFSFGDPTGSGGATAIAQCRSSGTLYVSAPHPDIDKVTIHFVPNQPTEHWASFGARPFLPRNSKISANVSEAIAIVLFIGGETKFALNGGWPGARQRGYLPPLQAPAKPTMTTSSSTISMDVDRPNVPPAPQTPLRNADDFEEETGIRWSHHFHNVDDDGNCLMTAFWLGLSTLLHHYPDLSLSASEALPNSSITFRELALEAIFSEPNYTSSLENQLQLWLELDAATLMSMEDFFLLPDNLQEHIIQLNQNCQYNGVPADMEDLVRRYQNALRSSQVVNGRQVFVPLGQLEMETLCEVYQVRLQIIKTESIAGLGPIESLDPRTIPAKFIFDRNTTFRRLVRLLNVNSNHYMVHLPIAPE